VTVLRAVRGSGEWERVLGPPLLLETRRAVSTQLQNELQTCDEPEQAEEKLRHWRAAIDVDEVLILLLFLHRFVRVCFFVLFFLIWFC
jgi:hypothetical protein